MLAASHHLRGGLTTRTMSCGAVLLLAPGAVLAQVSLFDTVGGRLQATAEITMSTTAFLPVTRPGPGSVTASEGPLVTSTAGYSFTELNGYSKIDITCTHYNGYTLGGSRTFLFSDANFTVAGATPYKVSGIMTAPLGQPNAYVHVEMSIIPLGGGPALFRHETTRTLVGGSSIIVGAAISGDILSGSLTGTVNPATFYIIALTISTTPVNWSQGPLTTSGTFTVALGAEPCRANCDGSTQTPVLTPNDFQCFLNSYAFGLSAANCDGSTAIPALTPNDFLCFINGYATGCS